MQGNCTRPPPELAEVGPSGPTVKWQAPQCVVINDHAMIDVTHRVWLNTLLLRARDDIPNTFSFLSVNDGAQLYGTRLTLQGNGVGNSSALNVREDGKAYLESAAALAPAATRASHEEKHRMARPLTCSGSLKFSICELTQGHASAIARCGAHVHPGVMLHMLGTSTCPAIYISPASASIAYTHTAPCACLKASHRLTSLVTVYIFINAWHQCCVIRPSVRVYYFLDLIFGSGNQTIRHNHPTLPGALKRSHSVLPGSAMPCNIQLHMSHIIISMYVRALLR